MSGMAAEALGYGGVGTMGMFDGKTVEGSKFVELTKVNGAKGQGQLHGRGYNRIVIHVLRDDAVSVVSVYTDHYAVIHCVYMKSYIFVLC